MTQGGAPVRLVIISCHLIADAFGFGLMAAEVRDRVPEPVHGMQALDQVRWQRSEAGQRQNTLALRYMEQALRAIPLRRFTSVNEPQSPRHWRGEFTSQALHLATQAIAARSNMDVSPASRDEILAVRETTALQWTDKRDVPFERLFVHIDDVPDTIRLTIFMDTKYFSPDDATAFLYGMQEVAIAAAGEANV